MSSNKNISFIFVLFTAMWLLLSTGTVSALAEDSLRDKRRKLIFRSAAVYTTGMTGLSLAWYKGERQSFRWFNDLPEWKQMDKVGHFYTGFHIAAIAGKSLRRTGMNEKNAAWTAAIVSAVALSAIEIPDGFSPAYGASAGDIGANVLGSLFWLAQHKSEGGPTVTPKFSFHRSGMAGSRPEVLGKNLAEQILKDYNGQTYWLSADLDRVRGLPRWLNLAAGYGAGGMSYGRDEENLAAGLQTYRRWFLGLDIDLTDVPTRHKFLRKLFSVTGYIRIPAPAIEFSSKGWTFHPIRF